MLLLLLMICSCVLLKYRIRNMRFLFYLRRKIFQKSLQFLHKELKYWKKDFHLQFEVKNPEADNIQIKFGSKASRLFWVYEVLFTMVGQLGRPLIGKRGGNIYYLCRRKVYTGFKPTSFRFEKRRRSKIQSRFEPGSFTLFSAIYPAQKLHL